MNVIVPWLSGTLALVRIRRVSALSVLIAVVERGVRALVDHCKKNTPNHRQRSHLFYVPTIVNRTIALEYSHCRVQYIWSFHKSWQFLKWTYTVCMLVLWVWEWVKHRGSQIGTRICIHPPRRSNGRSCHKSWEMAKRRHQWNDYIKSLFEKIDYKKSNFF